MPDERPLSTSAAPEPTVIAPEDVKVVAKPWGEEIWLAHTDQYAGKVLSFARDTGSASSTTSASTRCSTSSPAASSTPSAAANVPTN